MTDRPPITPETVADTRRKLAHLLALGGIRAAQGTGSSSVRSKNDKHLEAANDCVKRRQR